MLSNDDKYFEVVTKKLLIMKFEGELCVSFIYLVSYFGYIHSLCFKIFAFLVLFHNDPETETID